MRVRGMFSWCMTICMWRVFFGGGIGVPFFLSLFRCIRALPKLLFTQHNIGSNSRATSRVRQNRLARRVVHTTPHVHKPPTNSIFVARPPHRERSHAQCPCTVRTSPNAFHRAYTMPHQPASIQAKHVNIQHQHQHNTHQTFHFQNFTPSPHITNHASRNTSFPHNPHAPLLHLPPKRHTLQDPAHPQTHPRSQPTPLHRRLQKQNHSRSARTHTHHQKSPHPSQSNTHIPPPSHYAPGRSRPVQSTCLPDETVR